MRLRFFRFSTLHCYVIYSNLTKLTYHMFEEFKQPRKHSLLRMGEQSMGLIS